MAVKEEKLEYERKLNKLIDTYARIMFVNVENVRSSQLQQVRQALRGKGELLFGKKTLQRKIIRNRAESDGASKQDEALKAKLCDERLLTGNIGLLFTNADPADIRAVCDKYRVQAPARVGAVSPVEVVIPAGNTGLEPTQTSFFNALNIATKISKGTVEIVADKKVLSPGDKVDNSICALLTKLKISPFYYSVEIAMMWERGVLFSKEDLAVTDESLEAAVLSGISNVAALSLGAGIPTEASFAHLVTDAFKDLLGFSVETKFEFSEFNGKTLRQNVLDGKVVAASAAPAAAPAGKAAPAAAPAKAAAPPPPEEEEDFGMGGLF